MNREQIKQASKALLQWIAERSGPFGYRWEHGVPCLKNASSMSRSTDYFPPLNTCLNSLQMAERLMNRRELKIYADLISQKSCGESDGIMRTLELAIVSPVEVRFACMVEALELIPVEELVTA